MSKSIRIFTTGGTFDKVYPTGRWAVEFKFSSESAVWAILKRANVIVNYTVVQALSSPKDSTEIEPAERETIADNCENCLEKHLVVIHGTDTMLNSFNPSTRRFIEGTATVLARRKLRKTIVLTGAAQPACMRESDADFNLGSAITAAQCLSHGVFVAMNGCVYRWDECHKDDKGVFSPLVVAQQASSSPLQSEPVA